MFWNVRDIGPDIKRSFIRDIIVSKKLDFVGIQETIKNDFSRNGLRNLCGGRNFQWSWNPTRGMSGGILVGINKDTFEVINVEKGVYFIRTLLHDKKPNLIGI